jgi:SAM-dependent methyltransferase
MTMQSWPDRGQILAMAGCFRPACVLGAAAELDIFTILAERPLAVEDLAKRVSADLRAMRMLLDAVAALRLLEKQGDVYSVPGELQPFLRSDTPQTVLPMVLHSINIQRMWAELARVVKSGEPAPRKASIRGAEADRAAFIAAMHSVSGPVADDLVARLGPPQFRHLLDVGGASGTWTLAFLRAVPGSRATIFDLPDAIQQARQRLAGTEFARRVSLVPGDFYDDDLPAGADFAWVSAIAHQHSREHNRELFDKVHAALVPGGRIAIRDIVMAPNRIEPADGALFAINMLVNTDSGGTFTLAEFTEDLEAAGFRNPRLAVEGDGPFAMNSVVMGEKP